MRSRSNAVLLVVLLALAACGRGQAPIPAGAQVVQVVALESGVRLTPSRVHAGDVYLVVDEPPDGSIQFVKRKVAADVTPGPLSDDDLARVAKGDTQFTEISGLDAGGCSPEQNEADRGQLGYCGNVMQVTVGEGKYAVLGPAWREMEMDPAIHPTPNSSLPHPGSMAVLEVLPAR